MLPATSPVSAATPAPPPPPPAPPAAPPPCARYALRRAVAGDLPALRALHSLLEVSYDDAFLSSLAGASSGALSAVVCMVAAPAHGGGAVAAVSARVEWSLRGAVAALLGAGGHPGYVLTLAVAPAHRGRGLARALLAASCAALAAERGVDEVSLHCLAANAAARALYGGAGFAAAATLRGYYVFAGDAHGVAHDAVLYTRKLAPAREERRRAAAAAARMAPPLPEGDGEEEAAAVAVDVGGGGGGGDDVASTAASVAADGSGGGDDEACTAASVAADGSSGDDFVLAGAAGARAGFLSLLFSELRAVAAW